MNPGWPGSSPLRTPPPGSACASSTTTSQPADASKLAAVSPFGPAPMTTASGTRRDAARQKGPRTTRTAGVPHAGGLVDDGRAPASGWVAEAERQVLDASTAPPRPEAVAPGRNAGEQYENRGDDGHDRR